MGLTGLKRAAAELKLQTEFKEIKTIEFLGKIAAADIPRLNFYLSDGSRLTIHDPSTIFINGNQIWPKPNK